MNTRKSLSLKQRLSAAMAILLMLMVSVAAIGTWQSQRLFSNGDFYDWNIIPAYEAMHAVIQSSAQLLQHDDEAAGKPSAAGDEAPARLEAVIQKGFADYAPLLADDEDKRNFEGVKAAMTGWLSAARTARQAGSPEASAASHAAYATLSQAGAQWWAYNQKLSKAYAADSRAAFHEGLGWMGGILAAALVVGLAIGIGLTRSILGELGGEPSHAAEIARAIGAGQLDLAIHAPDDGGRSVLSAMEGMRRELIRIIREVRQSSDAIAVASGEVAMGSSDLSQRTEQQASSVQQTAASMQQLGTGVQTSAQTSLEASRLSQLASEAAQAGGTVMEQVVTTMTAISASSSRITDIIGVIDGIAFQTNILALNAAVEAARAGEQGRGFAVVASEVRSLAQRSAAAAKEIKSLIAASSEQVNSGSQLVGSAGQSMGDIVKQVRRVSDLISEISSVTAEQSKGLHEVGVAVSHIDDSTQQNAALVEESAAAAESLRQQAERLSTAIGVFKVPGQATI